MFELTIWKNTLPTLWTKIKNQLVDTDHNITQKGEEKPSSTVHFHGLNL